MTQQTPKTVRMKELLKNETVQRWLTGKSERTKVNLLGDLPAWLDFCKIENPTEMIQLRIKQQKSKDDNEKYFEHKWREYKAYLENDAQTSGATWNTIKTKLNHVASFFSNLDYPLVLKKGIHGDWDSTLTSKVIERHELSLDDIKRMYAHANTRSKSILLLHSQSGFSSVDALAIRIENIKDLYTMPTVEHAYIQKPREKTGSLQATCLSYEFLHDLRILLAERGNPLSGVLFPSLTAKNKDESKSIDVRQIHEAMCNLAEKAFGKDSDKAKNFETKSLRSFYNSALLRADLKTEIKDLMQGHKRLGARDAYSFDETTIREAYVKAFQFLTVNGIQSREDLVNIKAQMQTDKAVLTGIIGDLQQQLKDQEKTMLDFIAEFKPKIKAINVMADETITDQKALKAKMENFDKELVEKIKKHKQETQN